MRLKNFLVRKFRSVTDSGWIEVKDRTALVGRNESGKTNLLLALASLNPPDGLREMTFVKDFPRDLERSDFSSTAAFLWTNWKLDEQERGELKEIFPRAQSVTVVQVYRRYAPSRTVYFQDLPELTIDSAQVQECLKGLKRSVSSSLRSLSAEHSSTIKSALDTFQDKLLTTDHPSEWSEFAISAVTDFRTEVGAISPKIIERNEDRISAIARHARDIQNDAEAYSNAKTWILDRLPIFVYLDDYAEIKGHQDIPAYLQRLQNNNPLETDEYFSKLVKVAGLDPEELNNLLVQNHEERHLLVNRSSATVTSKIRELWTERQLSVRFNVDASHFDTFISDPNAFYPVEVNLDERSRGFKWFFSFWMTFAADTAGGPAEDAILLLDEPGLYLHAMAQRDLLELFKSDFENQILYTTHSPFMVPTDDISSTRTVNITPERGTTVTNDPTGDNMTLFPLQAALGYDITQTLFIGERNLVVEGVSDYWYLSTVSEYFSETDEESSLPSDLVITPAGGAQKVSYMVALLASQNLKVLVLYDDEPKAHSAAEDLLKSKLIRDENLAFITDGFEETSGGADIEGLLDPDTFHQLVKESYARELKDKDLKLNERIPRIVKRYEDAFSAVNIKFHKTRPAKLFLRKMAENPGEILEGKTEERFKKLFASISDKSMAINRRDRQPFS